MPKTRVAVRERTDCRLCGSADIVNVWSFGVTPLANSFLRADQLTGPETTAPLVVSKCQTCHLVQLRHVVDPRLLFANYLYISSTSPKFVQHFVEYAQTITTRFQLTAHDLVVDVGSNDGALLQALAAQGVRVLGIDPARNIARLANANHIETVAEFFTPELASQLAQRHGKAKVITANNVFAHTDDVSGFVDAVKEFLAADGVFIFEVQYLKDLLANNLFDIVYHEHLCYYHLTPLVKFFAEHELTVVDVERVPVHGGSIRVYVKRKNRSNHASDYLEKLLKEEQEDGLNTNHPYQAFAQRVAANRETLTVLLGRLKKTGARIVGYGAPAKATTLLYTFGIGPELLDYIVDDDAKIKQGMYMPGSHLPIVAPERLYSDRPNYCLILAWNFAEAIIESHKRFFDHGGQFIVPVPVPRLVGPPNRGNV